MEKKERMIFRSIRQFKGSSMFINYMAVISLVLCIPFTISVVFAYQFIEYSIKSDMHERVSKALEAKSSNIRQLFYSANSIYNIASRNSSVFNYLNFDHSAMDLAETRSMLNGVTNIFQTYALSMDSIYSIDLYHVEYRTWLSINEGGIFTERSSGALEKYEQTGETNYIVPNKIQTSVSNQVVSVCTGIRYGGLLRGILIVNLKSSAIQSILMDDESDMRAVLIDGDETVLFDSQSPGVFSRLVDSQAIASAYQSAKIKSLEIQKNADDNLYYYSIQVPLLEYTIVQVAQNSEFDTRLARLRKTGILVYLVTAAITLMIAVGISIGFYKKWFGVLLAVQTDAGSLALPEDKNEVTYITDSISRIISDRSLLEKELAYRIDALEKAQIIALQSQINPHFVANTLQIANAFVIKELKRDTDITHMLSALAELLRTALKTKEYIVTLGTELEYIKKYIFIQNIRYPDKFQFKTDIVPEALELKIIKLSIQPLIENAITHGIVPLKRSGTIEIKARVLLNHLMITVSDDGVGIDDETLAKVQRRLKDSSMPEDVHLGLANVNQRCKLVFGEKSGIFVTSSKKGTVVSLKVPFKS